MDVRLKTICKLNNIALTFLVWSQTYVKFLFLLQYSEKLTRLSDNNIHMFKSIDAVVERQFYTLKILP